MEEEGSEVEVNEVLEGTGREGVGIGKEGDMLELSRGQISLLQLMRDLPHLSCNDLAAISRCHNENLNVKFPVDIKHLKKTACGGEIHGDCQGGHEIMFKVPDDVQVDQDVVKVGI